MKIFGTALSMKTTGATLLTTALITSCLTSCGFIPLSGVTKQIEKSVSATYVPRGSDVKVWLVKSEGENLDLVAISRPKISSDALESALQELLQGPDDSEIKTGIGTEIPKGTILLGMKRDGNNIEINLSKRFTAGGGPTSMETRLEQLAKTIKDIEPNADVYVNVEGERLSASSADGLEIAQPINQPQNF